MVTCNCWNLLRPVKVLADAKRGMTEVTISIVPAVPPEQPVPAQRAPLEPVTRSPQEEEVPLVIK